MNEIKKLLMTGGVLRYRPPHGFYVVLGGETKPVDQAGGRQAVTSKLVRPNGKDQHGVYLFAFNQKAAHATVPAVPRHPQALPARTAAVPHALRDLSPVRGKVDSAHSAPVHLAEGAQGGRVPAGADRLDASGAPGSAGPKAGQGGCVGCGRCGVTGASKQEMKGRA